MVLANLSSCVALDGITTGDVRRKTDARLLTVIDYIRPACL